MKISVVYSNKMVADSGSKFSPSAHKPRLMAELLSSGNVPFDIQFVEPQALTRTDFIRAHDEKYVEDILSLKRRNGFNTYSQSVVDSLPYTNGAMYTAAKLAKPGQPSVALVSGFHHAGYAGFEHLGLFCTLNGLVITAMKLLFDDKYQRVAIVDCDMHEGNGTIEILKRLQPQNIYHNTFGEFFTEPEQAADYLAHFDVIRADLAAFKPDVVLYQSGADCHIKDPARGMLSEEQMYQRDLKMFQIAKDLNLALAWDLAGGYQKDSKGNIDYVLKLHYNTFMACKEVFG